MKRCQHIKLFNVTPHAFVPSFNSDLDLQNLEGKILSLLIPDSKLVNRNLIIGAQSEKVFQRIAERNGWKQSYLASLKKFVRLGMCVPIQPKKNWDEDNFLNIKEPAFEGAVCSDRFFGENPKSDFVSSTFVQSKKIDDYPTWARCEPKRHVDQSSTYKNLIKILRNFLVYSDTVEIHDQYLIPHCYRNYEEVHEFFTEIDKLNPKSEIIINRSEEKSKDSDTDQGYRLFKEGQKRYYSGSNWLTFEQEAIKYRDYFKKHLIGSKMRIKIRFWDYVHERYIFSKIGGFSLGKGLAKEGRPPCSPLDKTLKNEILKMWNISGNSERKLRQEFLVYPYLSEITDS